MSYSCPECGGKLVYDPVTRHYTCTSCGLYVYKEQLYVLRERKRESMARSTEDKRRYEEYMEWWSSKKKKR